MITNINIGKYGRLGNQLYQYAAAFSLSKKLNTELWLPEESENYNTYGRHNPVINGPDIYSNDLFRLFDLEFCLKKPLSEIQKNIRNKTHTDMSPNSFIRPMKHRSYFYLTF